MNDPHLLICVEKPERLDSSGSQAPGWTAWHCVQDDFSKTATPAKGIENPAENCWLIPVQSGLTQASYLLGLCTRNRVAYKVYLLDGKPVQCS